MPSWFEYALPFAPAAFRLFSGLWFADEMAKRMTEKEKRREEYRAHNLALTTVLVAALAALVALSGNDVARFAKSIYVVAIGTNCSLLAYAVQGIKLGRWLGLLGMALGDIAEFCVYLGISRLLLANAALDTPIKYVAIAAPIAWGLYFAADFSLWWRSLRAREG